MGGTPSSVRMHFTSGKVAAGTYNCLYDLTGAQSFDHLTLACPGTAGGAAAAGFDAPTILGGSHGMEWSFVMPWGA
eukprot:NODE_6086_length_471_cov_167.971564_g4592_i0.p3 GENE.NODE_6086_length_471_cov_167.971564_g4592_i0~~NODE_6086_length_471_cov_167.971564_g4592_i0.p3  ORF type:complete len:86 (+),score=46.48 NODE_6086_length_471_cov_167.971564_g4592_i0:32-259(+)